MIENFFADEFWSTFGTVVGIDDFRCNELVDEVDGFDERVLLADDVSSANVSSPSMSSTVISAFDEVPFDETTFDAIFLTLLIQDVGKLEPQDVMLADRDLKRTKL